MTFLIGLELSREFLTDIESAIGEALANAAEHGHRAESSFEVRVSFEGDALVIDVHDDGPGFPYPATCEPDVPASGSPRGFGMFIMRSLVDEIAYSDHGRHVRLTKRLPLATSSEDDLSANA